MELWQLPALPLWNVPVTRWCASSKSGPLCTLQTQRVTSAAVTMLGHGVQDELLTHADRGLAPQAGLHPQNSVSSGHLAEVGCQSSLLDRIMTQERERSIILFSPSHKCGDCAKVAQNCLETIRFVFPH